MQLEWCCCDAPLFVANLYKVSRSNRASLRRMTISRQSYQANCRFHHSTRLRRLIDFCAASSSSFEKRDDDERKARDINIMHSTSMTRGASAVHQVKHRHQAHTHWK